MFKFLIEGKSIAELKENIVEFFNEFEALQPSVKVRPAQDISAHFAAKLPDVPKVEAEKKTESISAPSVSVPTTPAPSVPVLGNDYGVDSRGLPWDERIHSVTQAKVKDGSWRYKRGVEEGTIRTVEAELASKARGMQESQMVPASPNIPFTAPAIPASVPQGVAATPPIPAAPIPLQVVQTPVAVVAPPPMPPPQPAVPSAHSLKTFKETLIPTLAKLVKDGKLTQDYINSLCAHYGVDMVHKVNEQQLEEIFNGFVQYGMIVKAE